MLAGVRNPTPDNWYERYNSGLGLERVEQGRRLVAVTPVLPEIKFMLDLHNVRAGPAWSDFVAIKSNLVRFAAAWSNPGWKSTIGRDPNVGSGDRTGSGISPDAVRSNPAPKLPPNPGSRAQFVP